MEAHVVTDVDHGGDIGTGRLGVGAHAGQKPGTADTAGEDHDPHGTILAYRYDRTCLAPAD